MVLEKVKSIFFIRLLFLNIYERKKLKLIKYNKKIQGKVDVNINNYKLFKRKYVIYYKNETAKEYGLYDDKLIYEGEYLNGERNGKGKEYNNKGVVIFEGEFKKGKKWNGNNIENGKGYMKEYNKNNTIIYEGEYVDGERNGKGKEYNYYGGLLFEGEYLYGKRWNGWGYDEANGKKTYELKFGRGYIKEYNNNKLIYEGEYVDGERNGKGKEYNYNGKLIFEGTYLNGERNGKGKEYNDNGELIFEGEYLYGFKIKGKEYGNKKLIFEGEYINEQKWNGKGKEYDYDGKLIFEGEYLNGETNGTGKEYKYGELIYEGEYLNGKKNGKVKEYYENGKLKFEGEYLNGKRWNGKGKEIDWFDDIEFEGEYINGEKKPKKSE